MPPTIDFCLRFLDKPACLYSNRSQGNQYVAARKAGLVVSDESNAGPYVTGGVMRLPSVNLDAAAQALSNAKRDVGVPPDAKIHCRVFFIEMHAAIHPSRT
jgi:hypothetical protein